MRLASTLNLNFATEENIPVAIFRYNGQRIFLRLAEDYQDMLNLVSQAFIAGKHPVALQTSTLDACRGEGVEIDESAYPLMRSVLGDIDVISQMEEPMETADQQQDMVEELLPTPMRSTSDAPSSPHSTANTQARDETCGPRTSGSLPQDEEGSEVEQMDEFATVNETDENCSTVEFKANEGGTASPQNLQPEVKPQALTEVDGYSTPQVKKEEISTPTHLTRAPRHNFNLIVPRPSVEAESRFEISIAGPGPNQVAQFKTRGKHTVGEVLAAACETFDIDVSRAHLYYVIWVIQKDGKRGPDEIKCRLEETMERFSWIEDPGFSIKLQVEREDDLLDLN